MTEGSKKIIQVNIEDEMKSAYIDYSMSVIISRALPDIRDGLKPVHRRILYGMHQIGLNYSKSFKKSARIVGEVLGKYHPHGDSSVYDAMVRMAQNWALRYPLVEGQGNFGSIDGDSPAAMRYTEVKLTKISDYLLEDLNKNTVKFGNNFDNSLKEPLIFPSKLPNLLINGTSGIAVGMATNMPPHNLTEVINGIIAYIDNNKIKISELIKYITAPDFPTGGIIYGYKGIESAFYTGRGKIIIRGKIVINNEKNKIIVTEIPYMVNKSIMIEKTIEMINEKKINGIYNIRDESNKNGIKIVYELKKDAVLSIVLNSLYKYTLLEVSFNINNVALVFEKPKILNLKDLIKHFILHRQAVVIKRIKFDLLQAKKKYHILSAYLIVLNNLNNIIKIIKCSKNIDEIQNIMISRYFFTKIQLKVILDMKLNKLTLFEKEKIIQESKEIKYLILNLNNILFNKILKMQVIKNELFDLKDKYGDLRKTLIKYSINEFKLEDIIPNKEVVITISYQGYIKRTLLSEYKKQGRGGVGSKGVTIKKNDFNYYLFIASNHDYLLIFTKFGKVYWKKVYEIPEGNKLFKGRAMQNIINISIEDKARSIIKIKDFDNKNYINSHYIIICTKKGVIKKTLLKEYSNPRSSGINAIKINKDDSLLDTKLIGINDNIIIGLKSGKVIQFPESDIRLTSRVTVGVRGIKLNNKNDSVIGILGINKNSKYILVVSKKGFGKKTPINDYRITKRGGKGIKTIQITKKTGFLISIIDVLDKNEIMIINKSGLAIRISILNLRISGRNTQGVKLIKLNNEDEISSVEKIENIY